MFKPWHYAYLNVKLTLIQVERKIALFGRFFYNVALKIRSFMMGRYGGDELNVFLIILSCILMFLSRFVLFPVLYPISLILTGICFFRVFSRNISKRFNERIKFLGIKNKITGWFKVRRDAFKNRKTHKYFRCSKCRTSIRVPRGVGKIEVTCPKCKFKFIKKA